MVSLLFQGFIVSVSIAGSVFVLKRFHQVLDLMKDIQKSMGMAILFITHDLGVVAEMADRVIVLYLGQIMEIASVDELFHNPMHPYTGALLASTPNIKDLHEKKQVNLLIRSRSCCSTWCFPIIKSSES